MSVALVTGASSGIGLEMAKILATKVDRLIITGRRENLLNSLAEELGDFTEVQVITADLSIPTEVDRLIQLNENVDILVNNAGYGLYGKMTEQDSDKLLGIVDVNIRALTALGHHYSAKMKSQGSGKILNVASIAAFQPGPGMAVYCASKSYVLSLSRAMSSELKGTGVSVTALCPGYVQTGFQEVSGMKLTGGELWSAMRVDKVAKIAVRAMMNGRREAIPGFVNWWIPLLGRILPIRLQLIIVKAALMLR